MNVVVYAPKKTDNPRAILHLNVGDGLNKSFGDRIEQHINTRLKTDHYTTIDTTGEVCNSNEYENRKELLKKVVTQKFGTIYTDNVELVEVLAGEKQTADSSNQEEDDEALGADEEESESGFKKVGNAIKNVFSGKGSR